MYSATRADARTLRELMGGADANRDHNRVMGFALYENWIVP